MQLYACTKLARCTMVSVVIVGPPMSGKTHLSMMLSGLEVLPRSAYNETCSTDCLKVDVNDSPWHIWDTPRFEGSDWPADAVAREADVIVVCHDGTRDSNPCNLIEHFGADRCIVALTRHGLAGSNLSWAVRYLSTLTTAATLVPIIPAYNDTSHLTHYISQHYAERAGLAGAV